MFTLKGKRDGYKFRFPKEFICPEIEEKYAKILLEKKGFYISPIEFLNESIQKIQVLGFSNAAFLHKQPSNGQNVFRDRTEANRFPHPMSDVSYRAASSPLELIDKTFNVEFRHSLGFLNYFLLFENFFFTYARDRRNDELTNTFTIDILNDKGCVYCKILLQNPIMNGMDMLDLDVTQPIAQSQTFKLEFKYSNFDFEFIDIEEEEKEKEKLSENNKGVL